MASVKEPPARQRDMTPTERPLVRSSRGNEPTVRFVPTLVRDDRVTPEWAWPPEDYVPPIDASGFADVVRQIADLTTGDETDEYGVLRPTQYALGETFKVVVGSLVDRIYDAESHDQVYIYPRGCVTTDEQGGLRIEWSGDDRAVHLVIPAVREGRSYIYHELGDSYGTDGRVSGGVLARWLQKLFG